MGQILKNKEKHLEDELKKLSEEFKSLSEEENKYWDDFNNLERNRSVFIEISKHLQSKLGGIVLKNRLLLQSHQRKHRVIEEKSEIF